MNLEYHAAAPIDYGLKVGDIVALSTSHPFTTFDKMAFDLEDRR